MTVSSISFAPIVKVVAVTTEARQISPRRWVILATVRSSTGRPAVTPSFGFTCRVLHHAPRPHWIIVRIATKVLARWGTWWIPNFCCVPFPAALTTRPRKPVKAGGSGEYGTSVFDLAPELEPQPHQNHL